jgi:lipopolysaccharide export system ATP-binding protein
MPAAPDPTADAVLEATGLRKRFGRRDVLRGIDLTVRPGEVTGLLGPNGAGKTTTFRILAGFLPPDGGDVRFDGRSLAGLPVHRRARLGIGYLPQGGSLLGGLTVAQNVQLVIEESGRSDAEARAREVVERAGLGELADARAETLSGGERRRLEIARILAVSPRTVLLDEPFTGVDPLGAEGLRARIRDLAREGVGVLITDHNVPETLGVCDRVALLVDGRVACRGTPAALRADPEARRLYLG